MNVSGEEGSCLPRTRRLISRHPGPSGFAAYLEWEWTHTERPMTRNVFLSFTMTDKGFVDLLRGQAERRQPALVFRDYSIKEAFEATWKTNAERLIRACSITLCLIGKTTHRSQAVDWEVRKSVDLGKHVMAVAIDPTGPIVPPALADLKVKPLPWDIERIVGELHGSGTE